MTALRQASGSEPVPPVGTNRIGALRLLAISIGVALAGAPRLHAQSASAPSIPVADSATVAEAVHRFHAALAAGDSAGALALLAPDAVILEAGEVESRAEYRAHHLAADIEFARAIHRSETPVRVRLRGDAAWASSTGTSRGTFHGRAVSSAGAELMVLTRGPGGWLISAVHWSSRPIQP